MSKQTLPASAAGTVLLGDKLSVNRMGFGAMRLTGPGIWGLPPDKAYAHRVLKRALELGVNFIDTADSYGPEVNETLIADALHPYPKELVIATKAGLTRPGPDRWERNGHPDHLRIACEGSLRRLKLECIDVFQLHAPDPKVPFDDSVGALVRLKEEGKIRFIGLSSVRLEHVLAARRLTPIVSVQNRYNFADRDSEPVLEYCERNSLAFIPWYPLGAGRLVGESGLQESELARMARERGLTLSQAAIAWLLARSPCVLPIPGTSSIAHLEENIAAAAHFERN